MSRLITIGKAAKLLGVSISTLRRWEEEELAKDVLEIITVFSARLYGSRSRKNQKLIEGMKKVVEDVACASNRVKSK